MSKNTGKIRNEGSYKFKVQTLDVPKDQTDPRFTLSFLPHEDDAIKQFFHKYGFAVVRDVLTPQDCQKTLDEIFNLWEKLTNRKFKRNDVSTWKYFSEQGIERYGSVFKQPIFTPQFLKNRSNPNVHRVWSNLLGTEDIICNHDRCCVFRPTTNIPFPDGSIQSKPEWGTKKNVHLDMNPWNWMGDGEECRKALKNLHYEYPYNHFIFENNQPCQQDGLQMQGVLNLVDNFEEDGGFITVPGFFTQFQEFFDQLEPNDSTSFNFHEKGPVFPRAVRITMRAGSMVLWDQRMPHGSAPNLGSNIRSAQFIKLFPRSLVTGPRMEKRKKVLQRIIQQLPEKVNFTEREQRILGLI